jgi:bacterioferritin
MVDEQQQPGTKEISPSQLIDLLNEDLSREYQAMIVCVLHSQVINEATAYRDIAEALDEQAQKELQHALIIGDQIQALGGLPEIKPEMVKTSDSTEQMLRFKFENGNETIRNYRERVRQYEALGEHAMAKQICEILACELHHQIELATALGNHLADVPLQEIGNRMRGKPDTGETTRLSPP